MTYNMTNADTSPTVDRENVPGPETQRVLQLIDVDTYYGPSQILHQVSLEVNKGEIVCLLGANAAGKTTTMKTIFGLVRPRHGDRKSTRLNSSHSQISYAVFCLKK